MSKRIFISADHGMAIIAGINPPAQYMEALRAGTRNERSRVRLSGLPRTQAGIHSAESRSVNSLRQNRINLT